ncbi:MAG: hypothetical protein QOE31_2561 [Solirubrobacteraceae bacterium]|nr:hypothetical protein [Solirubrobacteraceae bacterium]
MSLKTRSLGAGLLIHRGPAGAAKLARVLEPLRRVTATRYVAPLREGGSLPGLLEADDDGMYVTKFSGAGQGAGALVAEVLAGELARAIGLPVPELVVIDVAPELGHAEPDPEIQELLAASPGINLGMDFLPGSLPFAVPPDPPIDPEQAADVVWFDTLVTNVDRTHRNPNLIVWGGRTWLIDHGASFFRQHAPGTLAATAHDGMPMLGDHVLLPYAGSIRDADERLASRALAAAGAAVALVPPDWLGVNPSARRGDLVAFLSARLAAPRGFVEEIERARG